MNSDKRLNKKMPTLFMDLSNNNVMENVWLWCGVNNFLCVFIFLYFCFLFLAQILMIGLNRYEKNAWKNGCLEKNLLHTKLKIFGVGKIKVDG